MGKIYLKNKKQFKNLNSVGFTIVELLVVIVVIGILAAITIVSYSGITQRAKTIVLQSDLTGAKTTLQLYQIEHGSYPISLDGSNCPKDASNNVDTKYCLKASSGNTFDITNYTSDGATFSLAETNTDGTKYSVTDSTSPVAYVAPVNSTFSYTGASQTWTVPATGTYKLEVWGANGGLGGGGAAGGQGGYAYGNKIINSGTVLTVYVGSTGGSGAGTNYGGGGGGPGGAGACIGYGGDGSSGSGYGGASGACGWTGRTVSGGGGGGAASAIVISGTNIIIGGGGGGGGGICNTGGYTGGNGNGSAGAGNNSSEAGTAGGGGGYQWYRGGSSGGYGGGGGGSTGCGTAAGGGGGGNSYINGVTSGNISTGGSPTTPNGYAKITTVIF